MVDLGFLLRWGEGTLCRRCSVLWAGGVGGGVREGLGGKGLWRGVGEEGKKG